MATLVGSDLDLDSRHVLTLNLHSDFSEASLIRDFTDYKVYLTGDSESLLAGNNTILLVKGGLVTRNLKFDSQIINCFFTSLNGDQGGLKKEKVLVVVLKEQICVYEKGGRSQIVSFPFHIRGAFSFENGLVIGKEFEGPMLHPNNTTQNVQSPTLYSAGLPPISATSSTIGANESNFLTLLDSLGELGSIVSSSTTSFSTKEELVSFPSTSLHSIATTYNPIEKTITIYHTRFLNRSKSSRVSSYSYHNLPKRTSRKSSHRSQSNASTANNSSGVNKNGTSNATPSGSKNLEDPVMEAKQFRSTSDVMSYDRMASGSELHNDNSSFYLSPGHHQFETAKLRKDVIFTKLSSIEFEDDLRYLKIFNIAYNDQEAIVVCNSKDKSIEFIIFDNPGNSVSLPSFKLTYSLQALDAVPFSTTAEHPGYIVMLYDNSHVVLVNPFLGTLSSRIDLSSQLPPIKRLDDSFGSTLSVHCIDNKHYTLNLTLEPEDKLITTLIQILKYLANSYTYEFFWLQWCSNCSLDIPHNNNWKTFVVTLLSLIIPEDFTIDEAIISKNEICSLLPYVKLAKTNIEKLSTSSHSGGAQILTELAPSILLSLHLVREELRLNVLAGEKMGQLSLLLAQTVSWMGWSEAWFRYYKIDSHNVDRQVRFLSAQPLMTPPNLFESLASLFAYTITPYITFSQISEEDESIDELIIPRTFYVLRLFEALVSPEFESSDVVNMMVDYNISRSDLETFPAGVYLPLKNAIINCGESAFQWNAGKSELELIGRKDLLSFTETNPKDALSFKKSFSDHPQKDMTQILKFVNDNEAISAWDGQAEADRLQVTKLIFSEDRRFYELTKLLQTSRVQTATLHSEPGIDDHEKLIQQRALGSKVALRTLTMPLGRGAVFASSRKPLMTERFPIPKMNFNSLILPDMINVSLEKDSLDQDMYDWGYFHNGASAGLTISRDSTQINGSWIVFNRPPVLNAQHAGFLLGLGLNGHLKKLEEWHIYNYLGPKHNYTSVGLLLGMAASLKGSMDIKLTKVLSVHVVALLPAGSTNLNVQLPVQTAGLIGVGLLYLESQHRRMTEVLLSQISSTLVYTEKEFVSEGYRLAGGIALGYVNLGKGENLKATNDTHVIDRLFSMAVSLRDIQTADEFDKSCGGAIMALTLMFLRTENQEIAEKLAIPRTMQLLDYIRPDFLMLRCLGTNIILWDQIETGREWVESQIPPCMTEMYTVETIHELDSDFLPYLNVLGGVLLSIAIKYASTGNPEAKETLSFYFDKLMKVCSLEAKKYDERIALIGAENIRDVVILGLSLVTAGSGDLDVFRNLRYLQGVVDDTMNYGNYMAINTALGMLFLGGGQKAFRKDNLGIAALLTAIYPVYGTNTYSSGNESSEIYLQALRHFWALAVENRCLNVRDVDTKQPIKVEVQIETELGTIFNLQTPCLSPELSTISRIRVVDPDKKYFPVTLDFEEEGTLESFIEAQLNIFVYRRREHQDLRLPFTEIVRQLDTEEDEEQEQGCIKELESLSIFKKLSSFERSDLLGSNNKEQRAQSTIIDFKLEVERLATNPQTINDLWNLKLLFNFVNNLGKYGELGTSKESSEMSMSEKADEFSGRAPSELSFLNVKFIEELKNDLWLCIQNSSN
ncbi:hypothetical protein OGAPHI_006388 [Ogataea philodendri]|uniref:Anaphase-promoting complex subunit 1 N-terminal domain-containing protein n=1 Tax=Ogataea philodendri TaxID=1378263 RepID=A0A9P8NXX5_9ASCO|nr:uncharacterized protein OGAPHI_006388 [Ogataea philodendri]KAH3661540.1 hypothetical protein OGAPHI_006388 [Ogataea philodendri]